MDANVGDPPGFRRVEPEEPGVGPYYLTIPEGVKLRNMSKVRDYLARSGNPEVSERNFDFKRRKRGADVRWSDVFNYTEVDEEVDEEVDRQKKFDMSNLVTSGEEIDHKARLQETARVLDQFRHCPGSQTGDAEVLQLKQLIPQAKSVSDIVTMISSLPTTMEEMSKVVQERCFHEVLLLSRAEGRLPLSEWPNDKKSNWFSDVCLQAVQQAPFTLSFLLKFVVRDIEENLMPEHVIHTATIFAQLAEKVDHLNDALLKMNQLQLKFDGATDSGIDAQARLGLSRCSRTYKEQRDFFCEVADAVALQDFKNMPEQSTLDNCTSKGQDCTVEYRETETIPTDHLNTKGLSPEEVLALFTTDLVLVTQPHLEEEFKHFWKTLVPLVCARLIATHRQDVACWLSLFPPHHKHPTSHHPLRPAKIKLVAPHYYKVSRG